MSKILIKKDHAVVLISSFKHGTFKVKISLEDVEKVGAFQWSINIRSGKPYAENSFHRNMSRFILDCPKGLVVDHINRDTIDNRRSNLRICTVSENARNKQTLTKFGYKGIEQTRSGKYVATIFIGRKIRSTVCDTPELAALRYNELALKHFGEFAHLNTLGEEFLL